MRPLMRQATVYATLLLAGAAISQGSRAVAAEPLISDAALRDVGLTRYWQTHLPLGRDDAVKEAFLVDDVVYAATRRGVLFSITAEVGLIRWAQKLVEGGYRIYPPRHIQSADGTGHVLVPTTIGLFVIDRFSGQVIRQVTLPFAPGSAAIGIGRTLFMGSAGAEFHALIWNNPRSNRPLKRWRVMADGPVTAAPLFFDRDKLLFASQGGRVYACTAADKAFLWAFATDGAILADPAIDADAVYVASMNRSLFKIALKNGALLWRLRLPSPLEQGPLVVDGTVYQYVEDHGMFAVDAASGEVRWRHEGGRVLAGRSDDRLYVITVDGALHAVAKDTGRAVAATDVQAASIHVNNPNSDAVFLIGRNGRVLCARPGGVRYLQPRQVEAARQRLNLPPTLGAEDSGLREREGAKSRSPREDVLRSRRDY